MPATAINGATRRAGEVSPRYVRASLLPDDKVSAVRDLEAAGVRVTMVGDSINDAPVFWPWLKHAPNSTETI